MKLIVGLGNPGKKYIKTRHNVGWMILDSLAEKAKWYENKNAKALYTKININNNEVELLKPLTFMNNSGYSVAYACKNHNFDLENDVIVIHDDKDINLGEIKVQKNRNAAGHNGVKSIIQHLKTKNFIRIRVGIANDKMKYQNTTIFVLKKFGLLERKKLQIGIQTATEEIKKLF